MIIILQALIFTVFHNYYFKWIEFTFAIPCVHDSLADTNTYFYTNPLTHCRRMDGIYVDVFF